MISVYIHIPFCRQMCTYCDFCKLYKKDEWVYKYLESLEKEIKKNYRKEKVKTLYFGGGTPSCLNEDELERLFEITKTFEMTEDAEVTFECNSEDLDDNKLKILKKYVNRLSIGVQTNNSKFINVLGRKKASLEKIKNAKNYFSNINIDLMYGFDGQTISDLKKDIDIFLSLKIPHLSAYNLILEEHTKLYIDGYRALEDPSFDKYLEDVLKKEGYNHYEISNYALDGYESKHNQTYWDNLEYYGFGLGASGHIDGVRYDNTRSLNKYFNREYRFTSHKLSLNERLQNEFILGFRKIKGINKKDFFSKYGFEVNEIKTVRNLIDNKMIIDDGNNIYINPKYLYVSNEILVKFMEKLY